MEMQVNLKQTLRRYRLQLLALITAAIFLPLFFAGLIIGNLLLKPYLQLISIAEFGLHQIDLTAWIFICALFIAFVVAGIFYMLLSYTRMTESFAILTQMVSESFSLRSSEISVNESLLTTYAEDTAGQIAKLLLRLKANITNYRNNLITQARQAEKIQRELILAGTIQQQLLPREVAQLQQQYPVLDIYADLIPATQIGGDLYDYFLLDKDLLLIAIGDVCGKGVPASLIMLRTITALRTMATLYKAHKLLTPGRLLEVLNQLLVRDNPMRMFVTMIVGFLNLQTGQLDYANAGHNPPVLSKNSAELVWLSTKPNKPLGLRATSTYKEHSLQLHKNDSFLIYTDGIVEAMNHKDQVFSEQRLETSLKEYQGLSSQQMIEKILKDVNVFARGTKQSDDMTALLIRWKPTEGKAVKDGRISALLKPEVAVHAIYTVVSENDLKEIPRIQQQIRAFLQEHDVPKSIFFDVDLCIEEIVANIVEHGYGVDCPGTITIIAELEGYGIKLQFVDQAQAFNPCEMISRDLAQSRRKRGARGGRGVYLVSNLVDSMHYARENNSNCLRLKKHYVVGSNQH